MKSWQRVGVGAVAVGVLALLPGVSVRVAAGAERAPATVGSEKGDGAPQTAEEHFARAASYEEKAATYRAEAETHRKMLAAYEKRRGTPNLKTKTGREAPWIARMREHCEGYIEAAERLAAEADGFAEFHRLRGEEMKGR